MRMGGGEGGHLLNQHLTNQALGGVPRRIEGGLRREVHWPGWSRRRRSGVPRRWVEGGRRLRGGDLPVNPRRALRGGISKVNFHKVYQPLTIFPHKNEQMAPRTNTGYPHEGASVAMGRGPNPLHHRDNFSSPALRHGSLNSLFQVDLYLPSWDVEKPVQGQTKMYRGTSRMRNFPPP